MEMNEITWKVEDKTTGFFFVGLSWKDDDGARHYDCALCCGMYGFEVCAGSDLNAPIKCKTLEETIAEAKAVLLKKHDPFKYALEKVNANIKKRVDEARHTTHLRMAGFRGMLFSQVQILRNG